MPSKDTPAAASPTTAGTGRTRLAPRSKEERYVEFYRYLTTYVCRNGYQPSYREIANALGYCNQSGVHKFVFALASDKIVSIIANGNTPRGIKILKTPDGRTFPGFMVAPSGSDDAEPRRS